ncbi:MAG: phosphohydrolase [Pseudooceanicola sp.]|nr:phosphohydrolase [Pseudooceanicola sp.]
MSDPTFLHLTDLHFGDADDPHLHSDTEATMQQILARIAEITPQPAFAIASGDLTNAGDAASYRKLKAALSGIGMPVVYALGNHDTREGFYEGMLNQPPSDATYDHDTVLAGIHVITLDSTTPGAIGGALEPEQFDWLAGRLEAHPDLSKLLVIHHPPMLGEAEDPDFWRGIRFADSQRLGEMLRGRTDVKGILSGHIHHDRFSVWHGIPVIVGTGQHAATDILVTDRLRMVRGASFGIGRLRASGLTMALVPMPSDRAELNTYPLSMLRDRAQQIEEAAYAAQTEAV